MPAPQNLKNHTRFDPAFHFFLVPVLLLDLVFALYTAIHRWPEHPHIFGWWVVMSLVLIVMAFKTRTNALKVQDRVIRLEERLRFTALLAPAELDATTRLFMPHIVALRFASDAELPALVRRTLAEDLTPKQIKSSITAWRADNLRV